MTGAEAAVPDSFDAASALSERLALAQWLIAIELLDGCDGAERAVVDKASLPRRMSRLMRVDEEALGRAVGRLLPRLERSPWSVLDVAEALAGELFSIVGGRPTLRGGLVPRRLLNVVDPSALVPFCRELECHPGEPLDWLPVSPTRNGREWAALAAGSVDTHVHLAGCVPPAYYWAALMGGGAAFTLVGWLADRDGGQARRDEWIRAIAEAAWLRYRLAARLRGGDEPMFSRLPPAADPLWKRFDSTPPSPMFVRDAIARLGAKLRQPGAAGAGTGRGAPGSWARYPDPLRDGEPWSSTPVHPLAGERRLLHGLAAYLRRAREGRAEQTEPSLAADLLRYMRVRNAFYQAATYTAESYGLKRFAEALKRQAFLASSPRKRWVRRRRRLGREYLRFEQQRMVVALRAQVREPFRGDVGEPTLRPVRAIEMRVSLRSGGAAIRTLKAWLDGAAQYLVQGDGTAGDASAEPAAADETARHQLGLVVHFHKHSDKRPDRRCGVHDARVLTSLLRRFPELRRFIVGIDVAGSERSGSPRACDHAFAQIDGFVRRFLPRHGEPEVRLGLTFHAGEDPWDMLTGLRHVDEAVTLLFGDARGRIGHGLVLADDPAGFYLRRGGFTEPDQSTHVLDLVWAWGRCREAGLVQEHLALEARIAAVEARVRAGSAMTPQAAPRGAPLSVRVESCWLAMSARRVSADGTWELAQDDELLRELRLPALSSQAMTIVPDAEWLALLAHLQQLVRRRLAQRGVAVEANPTSNVLIGRYADHAALPYDALVDAGLQVSINTDNPGFMGTNLAAEFERLYEARLRGDATHKAVVEWLAERAEDARQTTFINAQTPLGSQAVKLLTTALRYRAALGA